MGRRGSSAKVLAPHIARAGQCLKVLAAVKDIAIQGWTQRSKFGEVLGILLFSEVGMGHPPAEAVSSLPIQSTANTARELCSNSQLACRCRQ